MESGSMSGSCRIDDKKKNNDESLIDDKNDNIDRISDDGPRIFAKLLISTPFRSFL